MNAQLVINSPVSGDDTVIGTMAEIPISITLAIADIREPDKRNSSFSKTITIPGTKDANILFEHIFNVTTDLNNFNPNLKTPCKYFVDGEKVFDGDLQLLRIKKKGASPDIEIMYEVSIVGRLSKAFLDLGNSLLTDIDFSDLNYTFNYINAKNGMFGAASPVLGSSYTTPLIDYGVNGGNTSIWDFAHLKPAIFELEYLTRIFNGIGKTFSGSYTSSDYAKRLIIPDNNEGALKMSPSQINAISFYAGRSTDVTGNIPLTYGAAYLPPFTGAWMQATSPYPLALANFNDDSTAPFYDGGGNYSTITFSYQAPINMAFAGKTKCDFEMRLNAPAGTNGMNIIAGVFNVDVSIVASGVGLATSSVQVNPGFNNWTAFTVGVDWPSYNIPAGTQVYVAVTVSGGTNFQTLFFNSGVPITAGSASIDLKLIGGTDGSWFSGTTANTNLPIGYTVDMNATVPKNIKQIDFLMSVIKRENLYMELDLTNPKNYVIERRPDFFLPVSQALDWTYKWDYQNETEIIPMGELDFRKYLFAYKSDGDKYNKLYKDAYGETYGQKQIDVENDFINQEKKTELIFAATPMVGNAVNTLVYPVMAQADGLNLKPMATQIRVLYWGGVINTSYYQMVNTTAGTNTAGAFTYPFAGTIDDPYNPTISIDWAVPKILYYSYPGQTFTTNNLYLRNYKSFIEQITDENSKIVVMWMYLTPSDIANFTFRKPVFILDSYYLVNKIYDYDPQNSKVTKVEFLRLTYVAEPVAENILIWDDGAGSSSGFQYGIIVNPVGNEPNGTASNSDGISSGVNNINQSTGSAIVGGQGNFIGGIQ